MGQTRGGVVTGIGLVAPLGNSPGEVLHRMGRAETAVADPPFDVSSFACPVCARVVDFDAEPYLPENEAKGD